MLGVVTAGLAFSAPTPSPPKFAGDFYTGEQASVVLDQGGYRSGELTCCSITNSPQCKVQAINMGQDVREQKSMQRTRSDSPQGSIVNWWGDVGKQMAVLPGGAVNSTHNWACAQAPDRARARTRVPARAPAHPATRAPAHPPNVARSTARSTARSSPTWRSATRPCSASRSTPGSTR